MVGAWGETGWGGTLPTGDNNNNNKVSGRQALSHQVSSPCPQHSPGRGESGCYYYYAPFADEGVRSESEVKSLVQRHLDSSPCSFSSSGGPPGAQRELSLLPLQVVGDGAMASRGWESERAPLSPLALGVSGAVAKALAGGCSLLRAQQGKDLLPQDPSLSGMGAREQNIL